jgi:threonine/homoserine/homoserine lactone efflux protein
LQPQDNDARAESTLPGVLWAFIPVAAVVTITPGAGTAVIVRSSLGGWGSGMRTIAGNEVGVLVWALLSVIGVSALIAASEIAFLVLKAFGAAVLVGLGVQSLWRSRRGAPEPDGASAARLRRRPFRVGVVTSLANPKLAVFFVALFPQFVGHRDTVLPRTLLMAALIVMFDFIWYSALAAIVSRAKRRFDRTGLARWLERISGTVLIGLGLRVAAEHR